MQKIYTHIFGWKGLLACLLAWRDRRVEEEEYSCRRDSPPRLPLLFERRLARSPDDMTSFTTMFTYTYKSYVLFAKGINNNLHQTDNLKPPT
jgi:hypothetical protein